MRATPFAEAKPAPAPGLLAPGCPPTIPDAQLRIIDAALRRFERLKVSYAEKVQANQAWRVTHQQDSLAFNGQAKQLTWFQVAYTQEAQLRTDTARKLAVSRGKAQRRGWLVALETFSLGLVGYLIISK